MKLIESNVELLEQKSGIDGIYKQIELAGRTCYKSEDKITETSAKEFVERMINSGHTAMLEHGTVYLKLPAQGILTHTKNHNYIDYINNPYSKTVEVLINEGYSKEHIDLNKNNENFIFHEFLWCYVTTNYRVLVENNWLDDLKYVCEPTEFHERRITLKFTTNIGVTREGNRHRVNSIAEESTRYCNYTKDKFGGEINIVPSVWLDDIDKEILAERTMEEWINTINSICIEKMSANTSCTIPTIDYYGAAIAFSNLCYVNLINLGWKPQQAREVLPLATKSEIVYTAFVSDWKHWFDLRLSGTTGTPHPNMKKVAQQAKDVLVKNNLWNLIYPKDEIHS